MQQKGRRCNQGMMKYGNAEEGDLAPAVICSDLQTDQLRSCIPILFLFHIVARCRHWRQPRANREAKGLAALPRPPGRGAGDSRRASLYGRRWRRE